MMPKKSSLIPKGGGALKVQCVRTRAGGGYSSFQFMSTAEYDEESREAQCYDRGKAKTSPLARLKEMLLTVTLSPYFFERFST